MIHRALQTFALVQVWPIKHPGDGQTIVAPKDVDYHGATSILSLERIEGSPNSKVRFTERHQLWTTNMTSTVNCVSVHWFCLGALSGHL